MLLNPLTYLLLAILSSIVGFVVLQETEDWLVITPGLFFILLFFFSLLRPVKIDFDQSYPASDKRRRRAGSTLVPRATDTPAMNRPGTSPSFSKLTAGKLRAIHGAEKNVLSPPELPHDQESNGGLYA